MVNKFMYQIYVISAFESDITLAIGQFSKTGLYGRANFRKDAIIAKFFTSIMQDVQRLRIHFCLALVNDNEISKVSTHQFGSLAFFSGSTVVRCLVTA